ncbi:MAG: response regulator, partial [Pseudomonadales bacterium]|nr:response regulator [Pseudomonadales bacterium]
DDLKDAGHDVMCENAAAAALDQLAEAPFDVVISDLRMPGMDGLELLQAIREHHPDTAVIISR